MCALVCVHWVCSLVRAAREVGSPVCRKGGRVHRKLSFREPTGSGHGFDIVTRMALGASEVVAPATAGEGQVCECVCIGVVV